MYMHTVTGGSEPPIQVLKQNSSPCHEEHKTVSLDLSLFFKTESLIGMEPTKQAKAADQQALALQHQDTSMCRHTWLSFSSSLNMGPGCGMLVFMLVRQAF